MREHFPYMAAALLFGVLGAKDPLLFILTASLILLWVPAIYGMGEKEEDVIEDDYDNHTTKSKARINKQKHK
jgi:hypothetical protein